MELTTGDKIDISCTWGDGPDVCVNIYYDYRRHKHLTKGFFPLDFTGEEAIVIGRKLIQAGQQAKRLDVSVEKYFDNERKG